MDDIVRASGTSKGAVATLAWLGAVNEVVIPWLHGEIADLRATISPLTRLLLRSIGAGAT